MFEVGDKYIHYTKYGGVNRGEVVAVNTTYVHDFPNKCAYERVSILTNNGVSLDLDGSDGKIYRVHNEITEEAAKKWTQLFRKAKDIKNRPNKSKIHKIDEDQETQCDNLWVE